MNSEKSDINAIWNNIWGMYAHISSVTYF